MLFILEADFFVRAIAEGLVGGMAAAAKGNRGASGKAEYVAQRVADLEVSFHAKRAVVCHCDFRCCHEVPPVAAAVRLAQLEIDEW